MPMGLFVLNGMLVPTPESNLTFLKYSVSETIGYWNLGTNLVYLLSDFTHCSHLLFGGSLLLLISNRLYILEGLGQLS